MTEPMAMTRFRDLADAYGADINRWPEAERGAALQMARQPAGVALLGTADTFDQLLDTWRLPPPAAALRDRIVRSAPTRREGVVRRVRLWWSGIGIAAALAGAAAGVAGVAMVGPAETASESTTSFGDVAGQES